MSWLLYGALNCIFCNLVEGNSKSFINGYSESGSKMPGYSLSLTVVVGCEEYFIGSLRFLLYFLDNIALASDINIMRLEIIFYVNAKRTFGKVSDVTL